MASFAFDSGFVSLDLLATMHRRADLRTELLIDGDALRTWAREARLPIQQNLNVTGADLDKVIKLREAIHALVLTAPTPATETEREVLNAAARHSSHERYLRPDGSVTTEPGDINTLASSLARDALNVLEAHRDHVKECADENCTSLFVDTSRGSRRRWCSMQRCGTRSKVSAHRQRVQNTQPDE